MIAVERATDGARCATCSRLARRVIVFARDSHVPPTGAAEIATTAYFIRLCGDCEHDLQRMLI